MKSRPTPTPLSAAQREALEARFALRLSARLSEGAQAVPHDIGERLRVAREQAVRAARDARVKVAASNPALAPLALDLGLAPAGTSGGSASGGWQEGAQARLTGHGRRLDDGPTSWLWRLASALPMLTLVVGLWGIHAYYQHEQVQAAAEVDTALLADDLPPSAYADPGFEEFLRSGPLEPLTPTHGDPAAAP